MATVGASLRCRDLLDFDCRMVLDDLDDLGPYRLVCFNGKKSPAASHRRKVAVGILRQDPQIAVGTLTVAAVAGDYANVIWQDAGLN